MVVYTVFYVIFFSAIPHKEMRFMLPCLPFTMIITGQFFAEFRGIYPLDAFMKLYVFVELAVLSYLTIFH
jgi:hypothetical protein